MTATATDATRVDPRLLHAFVALAGDLHFGRAAQRLHMSQPALSQQIQRLETQLSVALFVRTRHSVELTPAGESILPYAQQALAAMQTVADAAQAVAGQRAAVVRVGLSPGVHYLAERVLAAFSAAHPSARVRARVDSSGALAREVAAGELELAIAFATAPTPGIALERLTEIPAVLAVHHAHRLATVADSALGELAGETFAMVDPADGGGYNDAVRRLCRAAGFEPRTAAVASGPMAWESAVRAGCVGLTSTVSAASTVRGLNIVGLRDRPAFPIDLLSPATSIAIPTPLAAELAATARRLAARLPWPPQSRHTPHDHEEDSR